MKLNTLYRGDCLEIIKTLPENSIDSIITDPPYELGFMGKSWDSTGIANNVELWKECLRVLKPGGHLLAFSGTRTYHRMACAIEDAGFEVRDMIEWVYSTGFPKSLNIGKAVDKLQGNEREEYIDEDFIKRNPKDNSDGVFESGLKDGIDGAKRTKGTSEWEGWGTALKPAHEPICMARKPLAEKTVAENCLKYGTGGINIDESRVGTDIININKTELNDRFANFNTKDTIGQEYSSKESIGRFPANLIHDNSEEVRECFPESGSSARPNCDGKNYGKNTQTLDMKKDTIFLGGFNDSGNASRFFKSIIYQAKASKSERNKGLEDFETKQSVGGGGGIGDYLNDVNSASGKFGSEKAPAKNNHPTVKPIALMEYLIKMMTREGQIVLDPFGGSGTTGVACKNTNRNYILIEKDEGYCEIIEKRLAHPILP